MPVNPFARVQDKLLQVDGIVKQEMRVRAGNVAGLVDQEMNWMDKYLYPGVVLVAAGLGGDAGRGMPLACVVQFIRLAAQVHRREGEGTALRVLVGDYLYSKFFSFLCRYHAMRYLAPLSRAICCINEGGMLRRDIEAGALGVEHYPRVMELEYGRLMAEAAGAAALLGGAGSRVEAALAEFGLQMGTGWALASEGRQGAMRYLERASRALAVLPEHQGRASLEELLSLVASPQEAPCFLVG